MINQELKFHFFVICYIEKEIYHIRIYYALLCILLHERSELFENFVFVLTKVWIHGQAEGKHARKSLAVAPTDIDYSFWNLWKFLTFNPGFWKAFELYEYWFTMFFTQRFSQVWKRNWVILCDLMGLITALKWHLQSKLFCSSLSNLF